jgi:hypothetical protein
MHLCIPTTHVCTLMYVTIACWNSKDLRYEHNSYTCKDRPANARPDGGYCRAHTVGLPAGISDTRRRGSQRNHSGAYSRQTVERVRGELAVANVDKVEEQEGRGAVAAERRAAVRVRKDAAGRVSDPSRRSEAGTLTTRARSSSSRRRGPRRGCRCRRTRPCSGCG